MNKLWLEDKREVFLASFSSGEMAKDTNEYSAVNDFWRIKTYTKDPDKLIHGRFREFCEPYQVAQYYSGGTWNDYNAPFIIQVGACNLNCPWCFVPEALRRGEVGDYFSAKKIVDVWRKEVGQGIFRISGGEPFLAPDFIIDIGREFEREFEDHSYLWIDTNLLGKDYGRVCKSLSEDATTFGICGCFKGFDVDEFKSNTNSPNSHSRYLEQFRNAKTIIDNLDNQGELFLYIPEIIDNMDEYRIKHKLKFFMNNLIEKVHPNAPLRVTVLHIKEYNVNTDRFYKPKRLESGTTQKLWMELLLDHYGLNAVWLPQFQIPMRSED